MAFPWEIQGTTQDFDVGASVSYPEGKVQRLRFHEGTFLRANTEFKDALQSAVFAVNVFTVSVVSLALSKPAGIRVALPDQVAEVLPAGATPIIETYWKRGDSPLDLMSQLKQ